MTLEAQSPITQPPEVDQDWQEKIATAIRAREAARTAREGKSPVFPMNWSLQPATP